MLDILLESCLDILKTFPILLAVYALLYLIDTRLRSAPALLQNARRLGPFFGALAGSVPQCGFSAAATALYGSGHLAPATLVAVFIATSDEAIPLMLAHPGAGRSLILLILCKIILAVIGGYLLQWTLFRNHSVTVSHRAEAETTSDDHCSHSAFHMIIGHTVTTTIYLTISMLIINFSVYFIGEARLSSLLLSGSLLQPAICALIGLIPGCAISVLLTELFLGGTISFGAVIAGLSTGAGFGYVLLLQNHNSRKSAGKIIAATYFIATAGGTIIQILMSIR